METYRQLYKSIDYKNTIYKIPVRHIDNKPVLLLSDVQSLIPLSTALVASSKLIPFVLDPTHHTEVIPKRVLIDDYESVWEVHVPEYNKNLLQVTIETQMKVNELSDKMNRWILDNTHISRLDTSSTSTSHRRTSEVIQREDMDLSLENAIERMEDNSNSDDADSNKTSSGSHSPPPAFSSPAAINQHEAPPSYETSILSSVELLNSKIRSYEAHIHNRYKAPRWLSIRHDWIHNKPHTIQQVAYQLYQLEDALFCTAFSEPWIEERDTWLTLVRNARSERHMASVLLNLERHTVVMSEGWAHLKEAWISDLLEMLVLPLTHG